MHDNSAAAALLSPTACTSWPESFGTPPPPPPMPALPFSLHHRTAVPPVRLANHSEGLLAMSREGAMVHAVSLSGGAPPVFHVSSMSL